MLLDNNYLESLQRLLNILGENIITWEIEANMDKTNVMIFNTSGKLLKDSYLFILNDKKITPAINYCYLGVQFSLNGSFKEAIKLLAKKAISQLKITINKNALSPHSLFSLFDALKAHRWICQPDMASRHKYLRRTSPNNQHSSKTKVFSQSFKSRPFLNYAPQVHQMVPWKP